MQGQSLGEAEKLRQDRTNLHQSDGDVGRDGGACGGDAALRDGAVRAMFRVDAGYADAGVGHEDGGVEDGGNVGENGTGLRALDAADEEAGQDAVAAGGYASVDGDVGANDVSGQSVGPGISLFPCRVRSSLPCAARPRHPNPCLQQAWNPKEGMRAPCWGQTPFLVLALASLSRAARPVPDHAGGLFPACRDPAGSTPVLCRVLAPRNQRDVGFAFHQDR